LGPGPMAPCAATRLSSRGPSRCMRVNDARADAGSGLLTVEDVGRHLGVNVRHVRRLVQERRLPFIKWGRLLRFDPADIERFVEEHRREL